MIVSISGIFGYIGFLGDIVWKHAYAQSLSTPIYTVYRESTGDEEITTSAGTFGWDTLVSENSEIPYNSGNSSFDLTNGGHYLVMYSVPVNSLSGSDRSEIQSWIRVNGINSPYTYGSSYIRRTSNDFEGYNEGAAILEVNPGDDIDLRLQRTDTNTARVERTPNRSGIQILKLDDGWEYFRAKPAASQAITTSWSDVDLGSIDEQDASFSLSGNNIVLQDTGKYLITYSVGTQTTGSDRTNNEMRLMLNGSEIEATRSTAYVRAQRGSFVGISSFVGIIDNPSANSLLSLEVRRESSLQGTTNVTIPGKSGITITKLPDSAEYLRLGEAAGGQDLTTTKTPVTFDTIIEQSPSITRDILNTSEIQIQASGDYMFFHSLYNARTDASNNGRENPYLQWEVGGTPISYGVSGSYNRHSNDSDGITNSSHSSAGVILPSLGIGNTLQLTNTNEATNGSSSFVGGQMGIQGVNLQSLFSGGAFLSQTTYRFRDDSSDFDTDSGWLASENTDITEANKLETIRLRTKIENSSGTDYGEPSQFHIEWAETSGVCSAGLTWNTMGTIGDAWEMIDSAFISPDGESSNTTLLSNSLGLTHISSEGYHNPDGETILVGSGTFVNSSQKEYEFSIRATSFANAGSSYCFRLYDSEQGSPLSVNNYAKVTMSLTPVILDSVWGEAGKISSAPNGAWTTLSFTGGPYTNPVIVGRTNTRNQDDELLVFEARNITSTGAEVRLCDSAGSRFDGCENHISETIGYIVVDASQVGSIPGIDAGTFSVGESFDTGPGNVRTNYNKSFSNIPYVFSSVQSANGLGPVVTRINASDISGFNGGICQQDTITNNEDNCNNSHVPETFGWIAIDPTINPFGKLRDIGTGTSTSPSDIFSSATFSAGYTTAPVAIAQTVTNNGGQDVQTEEIQNITTSGMQYRSCELDNDDDCDTHNTDNIRWLAIEEGIFADEYFLDKTHYRWYENIDAITPTTPLANENTTLSSIPASKELRLRMLLQNSIEDLPSGVLSLKLQYGSGSVCSSISSWSDVGAGDWLYNDNTLAADTSTLGSSLLFGGGHNLQTYNESSPTATNPNPIPAGEWGEWDFSIMQSVTAMSDQYCFRVVTQNDGILQYSSYAKIDTSDMTDPSITSFSPFSGSLLPSGIFTIDYSFFDNQSGIETSNYDFIIQKFENPGYGSDISSTSSSLNSVTSTGASFTISKLPYGKYRAGFEIYDKAGNSSFITHIFYIDEPILTVSTGALNIGNIDGSGMVFTSDDTIVVTVETVGAAFDLFKVQTSDMTSSISTIENWDGAKGFGYEQDPFVGSISPIGSLQTLIGSEVANINTNGERNIYTYEFQYSVLLDMIDTYNAGDYGAHIDFDISLEY